MDESANDLGDDDYGEVSPEEQAEALAEHAAVVVLNEAESRGDVGAIRFHLAWLHPEGHGSWHPGCVPEFTPPESPTPDSPEGKKAAEFLTACRPLRCRVCDLPL